MLVINMSGTRKPKVNNIRAKLQKLNKANETEAVILFGGNWYYYSNDSIESLSDYKLDYWNFISYSNAPVNWQYHPESIPSENECKKLYGNNSQYLYCPQSEFLFYYDGRTQTRTQIAHYMVSTDASYDAQSIHNHLRSRMIHDDHSAKKLSINRLSRRDQEYITQRTGHSPFNVATLNAEQETCFKNRINNNRVNDNLKLLSIIFGSAISGFLVSAVAFGLMALIPIPGAQLIFLLIAAFCLLGAVISTAAFVTTYLAGEWFAEAMGKYKPVNPIPDNTNQDDIALTNNLTKPFDLDNSNELQLDLQKTQEKDLQQIQKMKPKQEPEKPSKLSWFSDNSLKQPKQRQIKPGSKDDFEVKYRK